MKKEEYLDAIHEHLAKVKQITEEYRREGNNVAFFAMALDNDEECHASAICATEALLMRMLVYFGTDDENCGAVLLGSALSMALYKADESHQKKGGKAVEQKSEPDNHGEEFDPILLRLCKANA